MGRGVRVLRRLSYSACKLQERGKTQLACWDGFAQATHTVGRDRYGVDGRIVIERLFHHPLVRQFLCMARSIGT
jgi:hypothetical protein